MEESANVCSTCRDFREDEKFKNSMIGHCTRQGTFPHPNQQVYPDFGCRFHKKIRKCAERVAYLIHSRYGVPSASESRSSVDHWVEIVGAMIEREMEKG